MPRTCKICRCKFTPQYNSVQPTCSYTCAIEYVKKQKDKDWKVKKAKKKKELMTLQDWIKITQVHVNKFIRTRDKDKPCISCGNKLGPKFDAGHYYNANNHWSVRFDEDNIHGQCVKCNQHLHGNLIPYRESLIKKIGLERYERLEQLSGNAAKFTIGDVKEILEIYKAKIKLLSSK